MSPAASAIKIKRQDGSTIEATLITRGSRGRERIDSRIYEPVVGLAGDVIPAEVNTTLDKPGLRFVVLSHGKLILTEHAERLGYMFYRDMCLVGIPEENVEPSPEHWYLYQELLRLKAKNQVPKTPIADEIKWHPEVLRRRAENQDGVRRIPDDEVQAIIDRVRAQSDNSEEARASARSKGLRVPEDEAPKSLNELVDKIKEKGRKDG